MTRPLPEPTPETQRFWDGAAAHELWIQRCVKTGRYFFYPRRYSPFVTGGPVEWVQASGNAILYSYNILHRPAPGFADRGPYALAVVELAEGPRMMTNIVGIANTPENLVLDMPLRVAFEDVGSFVLPVFTPAAVAG